MSVDFADFFVMLAETRDIGTHAYLQNGLVKHP
jgi:hypothetical protein